MDLALLVILTGTGSSFERLLESNECSPDFTMIVFMQADRRLASGREALCTSWTFRGSSQRVLLRRFRLKLSKVQQSSHSDIFVDEIASIAA